MTKAFQHQKVKTFLSNYFFILLFLFCAAWPVAGTGKKASQTDFKLHRGVNIGIWLSQTDVRGEQRQRDFTEPEVKQLHEWGFDFIRLPVDEVQLFDESGTMDEETLKLIENVLGWCQTYQMKVILDLHILRSHFFNANVKPLFTSQKEQDHLCQMWTQIAKRLNRYSENLVAFELMNEPVADKNEQWNVVTKQVIEAIRKVNKKRMLVVASNKWDSADNIPDVALPEGDKNIILTFHFYEPMILTHYTASWTDIGKVRVNHVQYPGIPISQEDFDKLDAENQKRAKWYTQSVYNKEWMRGRWQKAIQYAKQKGLTLFLGEFGCLPAAGQTSRINWVNDVVTLCNEYGIPRAYWEYKSGFGFCNWKDGSIKNEELMRTLVK